jgi:chromosome segregation ATPase
MNKLIDQIAAEGEADHEQKDWCKEETHKNEQEAARYEYKIEKHNGKLMRLKTKLAELEETLAKTIEEIAETKEDLKEQTDTRESDHAAFLEAKSDDEGAVLLLGKAIDVMSAFYKNNKAAMLQLGKQPVFDRGDQAPDATFSKASSGSGEAGGILSIMTMLKEDLEDEISNGVKTEKEDQFYFERTRTQLNALLKELDEKKTNLKGSIVDTNKAIDNEEDAKQDIQDLLDGELDYLKGIKPDCDEVILGFDEREKKRVDDTSALIESRELLAGMPTKPPHMQLLEEDEPTMRIL